MNYHPKHKSNSRTAVWIGAGVLAAVAIGAIIFIIVTLRSPMTKEEARAKAGIVYDSSATEGGWDNLSPEEIEARLNEKVAEGMINISANTAPIFEDGSSEGNLMLVTRASTTIRRRSRSSAMTPANRFTNPALSPSAAKSSARSWMLFFPLVHTNVPHIFITWTPKPAILSARLGPSSQSPSRIKFSKQQRSILP